MSRWAWIWAAVGMVGCSGGQAEPEMKPGKGFYADRAPPTRRQSRALERLANEGAKVDEALFRNGNGGLLLLRGQLGTAEPEAFVSAHPELFRGAEVVTQTRYSLQESGFSVRVAQVISGRRTLGRGLVFRYDAESQLTEITGRLELPVALPDPLVTAEDAIQFAQALRQAPALSIENVAWTTEGGAPRGAYRVVLDDELAAATRIAVTVDDQTGDVLETEEELEFISGTGRGVFGNKENLQIDRTGTQAYSLIDEARGLATYDFSDELPGAVVTSNTRSNWDSTGQAAGAAVDAHANTAKVFDYLRDVLQQDSIDGQGMKLVSTVHFGSGLNGAFWDGTQAIYGDGDGVQFAPASADLSVVAHELFHGVIANACQLGRMGESGALQEALADSFASLLLRHVEDANAWKIGAKIYTPFRGDDALRDLKDPQSLGFPDHRFAFQALPLDCKHDNGGAHWNATIPGHAIHLLAEGGANRNSGLKVTGLGAALATQVLARAMRGFLAADADLIQAAQATRCAARELGGEDAADVARQAWEAVGVLVPPPAPVPALPDQDEQEPNDTRMLATHLARGAAVAGRLDDGDVDLFRLDLDVAQDLEVALGGADGDADVELEDGLEGRVGHLETDSQPGRQAVLRGHAEAGTYFLRVHGTGSGVHYKLAVR